MANMVKFRPHRASLLPIIGVIVLLVIAGAAGVGLRWWQHPHISSEAVKHTPTLNKEVSDLQNLRAQGYNEGYKQKLDQALNDPKLDPDTRYQLYLEQGNGLVDQHQWQSAIDAYLKAEKLQKTVAVAELLADTYQAAGNKTKAIEYYNQAIARIPANSPTADTDKQAYQLRIQDVESQP